MALIFEDQTHVLRRGLFDVHNAVGVGYPEEAYHRSFTACCQRRGIPISSKQTGRLYHRETLVHTFQYDVLAEHEILLELKALPGGFVREHFVQIISYLKFWRKRLGLLVNFGQEKVKVERVPFAEKKLEISEDYEHIRPDVGPYEIGQAQAYLRALGLPACLVVNFGKHALQIRGVRPPKRCINYSNG